MSKRLLLVKTELLRHAYSPPIYWIVAAENLDGAIKRVNTEGYPGLSVTWASTEFFQIHFQEGWKDLTEPAKLYEVQMSGQVYGTSAHWVVAESPQVALQEIHKMLLLNGENITVVSIKYLGCYQELGNSVDEVTEEAAQSWDRLSETPEV